VFVISAQAFVVCENHVYCMVISILEIVISLCVQKCLPQSHSQFNVAGVRLGTSAIIHNHRYSGKLLIYVFISGSVLCLFMCTALCLLLPSSWDLTHFRILHF
jgi:hypothetical protein